MDGIFGLVLGSIATLMVMVMFGLACNQFRPQHERVAEKIIQDGMVLSEDAYGLANQIAQYVKDKYDEQPVNPTMLVTVDTSIRTFLSMANVTNFSLLVYGKLGKLAFKVIFHYDGGRYIINYGDFGWSVAPTTMR